MENIAARWDIPGGSVHEKFILEIPNFKQIPESFLGLLHLILNKFYKDNMGKRKENNCNRRNLFINELSFASESSFWIFIIYSIEYWVVKSPGTALIQEIVTWSFDSMWSKNNYPERQHELILYPSLCCSVVQENHGHSCEALSISRANPCQTTIKPVYLCVEITRLKDLPCLKHHSYACLILFNCSRKADRYFSRVFTTRGHTDFT